MAAGHASRYKTGLRSEPNRYQYKIARRGCDRVSRVARLAPLRSWCCAGALTPKTLNRHRGSSVVPPERPGHRLSQLIVLSAVPRGQPWEHMRPCERPPPRQAPHGRATPRALSAFLTRCAQSATRSTCAPMRMPLYLRSSPRKICLSFPHEQMMGCVGWKSTSFTEPAWPGSL